MKILSNKTYQGMVDTYNGLLEENKKLKEEYDKYCSWRKIENNNENIIIEQKTKIGELKTKIASCKNKNMQLEDENRQLKEENKELQEETIKLTELWSKSQEEKRQLEEKLKESMTDKYLVRKIPSGRRPKGQPMKLTSHTVVSNITRKMFNND